MRYTFPEITDIEAVRRLVEGAEGFMVVRRDDNIVFCYAYSSPEVFPPVETWADAVRRECRGLAFNAAGQLISRPYHKFFNVGERPETLPELVDLSEPHVILEKLDGSMIRPMPTADGYRLGTKSGVSLLSHQPEAFVAAHPAYDVYIRAEIDRARTPIFEWCSRQQRIILDHPADRLVLTAVRENRSGRYLPLAALRAEIAANPNFAGIEIIRDYAGTTASMAALIAETRALEGAEGYVIRFADGHMVKLKGVWYVTRHRALDGLSREKVVIATLLEGAADDVKPLLPDEARTKLEAFERRFWAAIEAQVAGLNELFAEAKARYGDDKKAFALGMAQQLDPQIRTLLFSHWAGGELRALLLAHIAKNANTSTKLDRVRWAFGDERWDFAFDGDA